ncbi:MAG: sigma-70 family RNA polymerase sigma factor [Actinophytocola sp.]|nr:sigma-70 family RNA polymerase sigma factor [Actinophytocola sp.]
MATMASATLDATEDAVLVEWARSGDDRALGELLRRYTPRVRRQASHYFLAGGGGDRDDLVQEGMIGLYKAVHDYTGSKGVPFAPFVELCVKRQLISAVRAATRFKHALLSDAAVLTDHTEAHSVAELSALERGALRLHLDGLSLKESAEALRTRSKAVDNALQRARRKMHAWADTVVTGGRPATVHDDARLFGADSAAGE